MSHRRQTVEGVIASVFDDDGSIPNSELPVLIYKRALGEASAPACRGLFAGSGWTNSWVNGVYAFHHHHSTAHEVLGVVAGSARITLGGEKGETFRVEVGDAIVIPAGRSLQRGLERRLRGRGGVRAWTILGSTYRKDRRAPRNAAEHQERALAGDGSGPRRGRAALRPLARRLIHEHGLAA